MLQKAFGLHEAQTAWAFFKISRWGEEKKETKKEKRNERGGSGLSAPEASVSATSAAAGSSDKGGQDPASLPLALRCLRGRTTPSAPCPCCSGIVGARWPHGTASPSLPPCASVPCQLCPAASGSDVVRPRSRCQTRSWHWGRPALLGGLPRTPFPRWVSASGQTT